MKGLASCPWCGWPGGKLVLEFSRKKRFFYVRCGGFCVCRGKKSRFERIAIWNWNHRRMDNLNELIHKSKKR